MSILSKKLLELWVLAIPGVWVACACGGDSGRKEDTSKASLADSRQDALSSPEFKEDYRKTFDWCMAKAGANREWRAIFTGLCKTIAEYEARVGPYRDTCSSEVVIAGDAPKTVLVSGMNSDGRHVIVVLKRDLRGDYRDSILDDSRAGTGEEGREFASLGEGATSIEDEIYLWGFYRLIKLDRDFQIDKQLTFKKSSPPDSFRPIGAVEAHGDHLFVSAEGDFMVLNRDLEIISRLPLWVTDERKKNAHDIMIYRDIAYLLDNARLPIFMFRADVKDVRRPKMEDRIETTGINTHLSHQWLDEKRDVWYVHRSREIASGEGDDVVRWIEGNRFKTSTEIGFRSDGCWRPSAYDQDCARPRGIQLRDITRQYPQYAILRNFDEGGAQLVRFDYESEFRVFKKIKSLPFAPKYIGESENLLWTFGEPADNCVEIFQKRSNNKKVASFNLRKNNLVMVRFVHVIE